MLRIEHGTTSVSTNDLLALLRIYRQTDPGFDRRLVSMARLSRLHSIYYEFREVLPENFLRFLQYEVSASNIRWFEAVTIPGILQTEEYARAFLGSAILLHKGHDAGRLDRLVAARNMRQELLQGASPPAMNFIIDESVIRRHIGGIGVMRRQLEYLRSLASLPHIRIQLLPFTAGIHPGTVASFTTLEFRDHIDEDVLYVEDDRGGFLDADDATNIKLYVERFQMLSEVLPPRARFRQLIDDILNDPWAAAA